LKSTRFLIRKGLSGNGGIFCIKLMMNNFYWKHEELCFLYLSSSKSRLCGHMKLLPDKSLFWRCMALVMKYQTCPNMVVLTHCSIYISYAPVTSFRIAIAQMFKSDYHCMCTPFTINTQIICIWFGCKIARFLVKMCKALFGFV
jgi:hypothetical protein